MVVFALVAFNSVFVSFSGNTLLLLLFFLLVVFGQGGVVCGGWLFVLLT